MAYSSIKSWLSSDVSQNIFLSTISHFFLKTYIHKYSNSSKASSFVFTSFLIQYMSLIAFILLYLGSDISFTNICSFLFTLQAQLKCIFLLFDISHLVCNFM